ncbi:hypothetical protein MMC25_000933 [Agyrium rufum]|nr:hypothetical protein [Agyrium rufum]
MFKKKPTIKTLAPLRSSDRRKVADQIIRDYGIKVPESQVLVAGINETEGQKDEGGGDEEAAAHKALGLSALRNKLLPEGALSAKFTTTEGPNLKVVNGTVYVGSYQSDQQQRILWFRLEDRIYPTVYSLWINPHLVPLLHTPDFVVDRIYGGADLMTPGLAGPPFPERATKDSIVAVAGLNNPGVPTVVGVCAIDISALKQAQGAKGHAVRAVHTAGDEIWAWSAVPGSTEKWKIPEGIIGWDTEDVNGAMIGVGNMDIEDGGTEGDEGGVSLSELQDESSNRNSHLDGEDIGKSKEEAKEMSTKDIDDAFHKAFFYAIQEHMNRNPRESNHGIDLPVPSSLVMTNLVLPYLPIFSSSDAANLQIKKTSWKSAKKFIKALDKSKLIKAKDRNGGETIIQDIDFNNPTIKSFVPYKLPKKNTSHADPGGGTASSNGASSGDALVGQKLQRLVLYRPKESIRESLFKSDAPSKIFYSSQEIRTHVTDYITAENLVMPTNKRFVTLDPILSTLFSDSASTTSALDREVLAKGTVPRDALIDRIITSGCSPFHLILRNEEIDSFSTSQNPLPLHIKPKAGGPPIIRIQLETRTGNKTATKVSGLEVYHVSPQLLGDELQKACASSVSIQQAVGSSPKTPVMEIMVQGPQTEVIMKALEKRGVDRRWVEVTDKTKKGKK